MYKLDNIHDFFNAVGRGCSANDGGNAYTWNHRVKFTLHDNSARGNPHISIDYIRAMRPGHNDGTRFMAWLTATADRHSVPLSVVPAAQSERLKQWYGRFDFVDDVDCITMIRDPALEN